MMFMSSMNNKPCEESTLLVIENPPVVVSRKTRIIRRAAFVGFCALLVLLSTRKSSTQGAHNTKPKSTRKPTDESARINLDGYGKANVDSWELPMPSARCRWVVDIMTSGNLGKNTSAHYHKMAEDANVFYRGSDRIFWHDFAGNATSSASWGVYHLDNLGTDNASENGLQLQRTSTWTWITGDQHLSNFGAWMDRKGEVRFTCIGGPLLSFLFVAWF